MMKRDANHAFSLSQLESEGETRHGSPRRREHGHAELLIHIELGPANGHAEPRTQVGLATKVEEEVEKGFGPSGSNYYSGYQGGAECEKEGESDEGGHQWTSDGRIATYRPTVLRLSWIQV